MDHTLHKPLNLTAGPDSGSSPRPRGLTIRVLFTEAEGTERALRHAGRIAAGAGARIELIVAQVVPWPLPLSRPDVDRVTRTRMLIHLVERSGVTAGVFVYFCRDREKVLDDVLPRGTPVIVGGRKQVRALRRRGHSVIVADTEGGNGFVGRLLRAFHDSALRNLLAVREGVRSAVR